jgi:5'-3' exonuclease
MKEELERLKSYIQLTEAEAKKRDQLEKFYESRDKIVLLDSDSILFFALHKLYTFTELRGLVTEHDRATCEDIILNNAYERFYESVTKILLAIEDKGFMVNNTVFCFTTCKNNFRKELEPTYKANRKKTPFVKWVYKLKNYAIDKLEEEGQDVHYSDTLEADDIISMIARNLPKPERLIIASLDKDLKQIPGCHFDYKQLKGVDIDMESGEEYEYKYYKGFSFTSEDEGNYLLMKQLLVGDTADNIKGVKGIGKVKATKIKSRL